MCGRYVITSHAEAIRRLFDTTNPPVNFAANWNVAPTQDVLAVRFNPESRASALDKLRWGLIPIWATDKSIGAKLINARGETLAEKPSFRDAFNKRRCLIPADAFYEWRKTASGKQAYAVALAARAPMAFAGLWERWKDPAAGGEIVRSCAIVTTAANALLAPIHERMPVIVPPEGWKLWLGEADGDPAALVKPFPAELMEAWPISARVNSVKNNDAALLAPAAVTA